MSIAGESPEGKPPEYPSNERITKLPGGIEGIVLWTDYAVQQAVIAQKTIESTVESAIDATRSRIDRILTTSSAHFNQTIALDIVSGPIRFLICPGLSNLLQDSLQDLKSDYSTYEDIAFGKIKEGCLLAASHPLITTGAVLGVGFLGLKRTRQFFYYNTMRLLFSEETLLSRADAKVKQLRQSIDLLKAESEKLEGVDRSGNARRKRKEMRRRESSPSTKLGASWNVSYQPSKVGVIAAIQRTTQLRGLCEWSVGIYYDDKAMLKAILTLLDFLIFGLARSITISLLALSSKLSPYIINVLLEPVDPFISAIGPNVADSSKLEPISPAFLSPSNLSSRPIHGGVVLKQASWLPGFAGNDLKYHWKRGSQGAHLHQSTGSGGFGVAEKTKIAGIKSG
ncbi:UNVERIFIED_CONTAM: hypothetical protein Scaly_1781400 [Sesamum calycinum]|uniref:Uncharacterized protein n=1 Tax=Sesamum calycinum TaxID=2727403 RepID=A0AAW2NVN9_9LAMI